MPKVPRFLEPLAGFGVTFATMFRKKHTEQYPEERVPVAPRYHGRHQLNRYADGLEKCIGCELCAWACPADAIFVEGADNTDEERFSPGERYGSIYQINYLRCIGCGLCVEACPTRALTMTNEYEMVDDNRAGLIYEKHDLLGPMLAGMVPAPHDLFPGTTQVDYYRGDILRSSPEQGESFQPEEDETAAESAGRGARRGRNGGRGGEHGRERGEARGKARHSRGEQYREEAS